MKTYNNKFYHWYPKIISNKWNFRRHVHQDSLLMSKKTVSEVVPTFVIPGNHYGTISLIRLILSFWDVYIQHPYWRKSFLTLFDDLRAVPIQNSDIINSYISWTSGFYDALYDKLWQNILFYFIFFNNILVWLTFISGKPRVIHQPYWVARRLIRWAVPGNLDSVFTGLALYQRQSCTN